MFQIQQSLKHIRTNWSALLLELSKQKSLSKELAITEEFIQHKLQIYGSNLNIYPPFPLYFNAFNFFDYGKTKVVIIGQDPYHQYGQAMGLSFSVPNDIKVPPSLVNIYKELEDDLGKENFTIPKTGNLTKWAEQGILLLNASLSVLEDKPNSHQKYWEYFTDAIVTEISTKVNHIVFMLWGNFAKKKKSLIENQNKHLILVSNHPSPLSANRGGWFGCKHFSKANEYLIKNNRDEIKWNI